RWAKACHNLSMKLLRTLAASALLLFTHAAFAWGPDGHMWINYLAGQNIPATVPAFLRSPGALDSLAYYGLEPDRWRSAAEPELNAAQAPEHYILLDLVDQALAAPLPHRRYDYIRALAAAQSKHPDLNLTPEHVGLQPYVTTEVYERLQSAFRDYRAALKTHEDLKPIEAEVLFYAGWLGHYVGDGAQPMHTSIHINGWVGPNPHGYITQKQFHWAFENDFVSAALKSADIAPLVAASKPQALTGDVFEVYIAYLRDTNTRVENLYQLQKAGDLTGRGTPAGRTFTAQRLADGAIELRNLIYTAWLRSAQPSARQY
ncbi:MAG TPA: hypothetical protein VN678_13240, partial [Acidobacteriaceae bacterium]|nr:hypothetical protein [Acidobacteriaceae bacterium]